MKCLKCLLILIVMITPQLFGGNDFGLGIIAGEPTGISVKYWTGNNRAFDAAFAWSFSGEDKFHIHGDYLFHSISAYSIDNTLFDLYYGAGLKLKFTDETEVGIRFPLGTAYSMRTAPLDFFVELVPVMNIAPDTELDLNAGAGIRYYF